MVRFGVVVRLGGVGGRGLVPARAVLPQPLRRVLGPAAVHREGEPAAFLGAQMHDVRAQQHGRHRGGPEEAEAADRRDDRAEGEGQEEDDGGPPAPRQDLGALGAPGPLGVGRTGARASPGGGHVLPGALAGPAFVRQAVRVLTVRGLVRKPVVRRAVGCLVARGALGRMRRVAQPGFRVRRRRGKGPDVHGFHTVRFPVRVDLGARLLGSALPQLLGVTALHRRPAGQQPDGGAEAFRRTGFVELVLPAEPHRHQVGGPGPDDDCVDEAAAAHAHTVEGFARKDPPIGPVCRTIRLISRTFL